MNIKAPDTQNQDNTAVFKDNKKKIYLSLVGAALILAAAAGIFLSLAFIGQYDRTIDHFDAGSPLLIASLCLVAAAFVPVIVLTSMFYKKVSFNCILPQPVPMIFICALCGFMQLTFAVMRLIDMFTYGSFAPLDMARCIVAIPTCAYFFLATSPSLRGKPVMTLAGFMPVVYFILSLMNIYFSNDLALNSPQKILAQVTFVSLALFFTAECRFCIDRVSLPKYLLFGASTAITLTLVWMPQIIQTASGNVVCEFSLLGTALCCSYTLYAAARILCAASILTPYVEPPKKKKTKDSEPADDNK